MTRKTFGQGVLAASVGLAATVTGCGQGAGSEPSASSTDALKTVLDCQAEAGTCLQSVRSPVDFTACNDALRSCLLSLFPEAGSPRLPGPFDFDAALPSPPVLPAFDAGLPPLPRFDAGPPTFPQFDAGLPTFPQFDAGAPPRFPPGLGDAGLPSQAACLVNLQTCLFSQADPASCGDQARTCLTAAQHAQCLAQEQQCVAAGIPQAACTALTGGCP